MASKTAIVILNWNGRDMMRRFLPSVVANTPGADIIVADNGSTDGSAEMLAAEFPTVRQIQLDRNYGFAGGYDMALRHLDATYYILLNSDVEVPPHWLDPLVSYMDANPDVAACQPKLRCEWNRDYFEYAGACGGYVDALGYPYCRGRLMGTVEKDEGQYDFASEEDRKAGKHAVYDCMWATGACLMIRSADYWQAGGLDARFFAHQEEIDLCWRLRSRNRRIVCITESTVYHYGGGTLPQGNPRKNYLNFRNNMLLLYKNLPDNRLRTVVPCRFWLDIIASLQFLLTGQGRSFIGVYRAKYDFHRIRHDYKHDRRENLAESVLMPVPEQGRFSLLWQYYVRRRRRFSQLPR